MCDILTTCKQTKRVALVFLSLKGDCRSREEALILGVELCDNGFMHHGTRAVYFIASVFFFSLFLYEYTCSFSLFDKECLFYSLFWYCVISELIPKGSARMF